QGRQAVDAPEERLAEIFGEVGVGGVELADAGGEFHHLLGVVLALLLVAVENFWLSLALDNHGQLPRQVHHVAKARIETLAEERRLQMCGITSDEDPALAEG